MIKPKKRHFCGRFFLCGSCGRIQAGAPQVSPLRAGRIFFLMKRGRKSRERGDYIMPKRLRAAAAAAASAHKTAAHSAGFGTYVSRTFTGGPRRGAGLCTTRNAILWCMPFARGISARVNRVFRRSYLCRFEVLGSCRARAWFSAFARFCVCGAV